jgi:hypothetical protein
MGQCRHGELLLVIDDRARGQQELQDTRQSKSERIRLLRTLLQSKAQALDDRLSEPYGVQEAGLICLTVCHPNRGQTSPRSFRRTPATFGVGFFCLRGGSTVEGNTTMNVDPPVANFW